MKHPRYPVRPRRLALTVATIAVAPLVATGAQAAQASSPQYTLTVKATSLPGQSDSGASVILLRVDGSSAQSFQGFVKDGVLKLTVPAGTYSAISFFADRSGGKRSADHEVLTSQFKVVGDRTLTVRESAANSLVTMVTPKRSVAASTLLDLFRTNQAGNGVTALILLDNVPVWISPVPHRPSDGTWSESVAQARTAPSGTAQPYMYSLSRQPAAGTIPAQRWVVEAGSLATVHARYDQEHPSDGTGYSLASATLPSGGTVTGSTAPSRILVSRFGSRPAAVHPQGAPPGRVFPPWLFSLRYPLHLPGTETEYYTASPKLVWQTGYWQAFKNEAPPAVPLVSGGQNAADQTFAAGHQYTVNWNAFPLHPATDTSLTGAKDPVDTTVSAGRAGNLLRIDVAPFGDNQPGHTGAGFAGDSRAKLTGSYQVDQNGVRIAGGNAVTAGQDRPPFLAQAKLADKPTMIRFALSAARAGSPYQLSASSQTVWTWRSVPSGRVRLPAGWSCGYVTASRACAAQPLVTLSYQVAGMSLTGRTAAGQQSLLLTAGHLTPSRGAKITGASVQVSTDGGRTWHAATVHALGSGRYRVTFAVPSAGTCIGLKAHAADAAGGQVSEHITCAWQTAVTGGHRS